MRNAAVNRMDEGKGIGKVSILPDFVLGIMGRIDARKGTEGVPDAMIEKMLSKCSALEKKEATKTVKRTKTARKNAVAAAVTIIRNYKKSDLQMVTGENGLLSVYDVRENDRRASANAAKHRATEDAVAALTRFVPELEHAQAVLCERVEAIRSKSFRTKANAYIKGVRKGKLPEYKPEIIFDDKGLQAYKNAVGSTDETVIVLFNQIKKGEITV